MIYEVKLKEKLKNDKKQLLITLIKQLFRKYLHLILSSGYNGEAVPSKLPC